MVEGVPHCRRNALPWGYVKGVHEALVAASRQERREIQEKKRTSVPKGRMFGAFMYGLKPVATSYLPFPRYRVFPAGKPFSLDGIYGIRPSPRPKTLPLHSQRNADPP
jgi:hypothetical protein